MKNKCEICGATSSLEQVYACACDENSPSAALCKKCKEKYFDYTHPTQDGFQIFRPIPRVEYIPYFTYAENLVYAYRVRYGDDKKTKKDVTTMNKEEAPTMQVTYNGFTGELVKMERKEGATKTTVYDLSLYDSEKQATVSFTGVKFEDMKFLGGVVTFGE